MYKPALLTGCVGALLSVILGAFGAHFLKSIFSPELLQSFEAGVRYQFYHSIALLLLGIIAKEKLPHVSIIFYLFTLGIILFSGSIYALCYFKNSHQIGLGGFGILTPVGGVLFIAGWFLLFISIFRTKIAA